MAIKVVGLSSAEVLARHAMLGWQCPECYGVRVQRTEDRYGGGRSFDRFSCEECGAQWGQP